MKNTEDMEDEDDLWDSGSFTQSMSPAEMEQKEKTIHMKHDENVNYDCQKCKAKMSAHNRDWHDGMCDRCFDATYFPGTWGRKATVHYPTAQRSADREMSKTPLVKVLEGMRDEEQRKKPKRKSNVRIKKEKSLMYYSGWGR